MLRVWRANSFLSQQTERDWQMSNREIICIMCPLGCRMDIHIEGEEITKVEGSRCKQGIEYARQEVFSPGRILTTTVKTGNSESPLLPVRSDKSIPKEKLEESMGVIAKYVISGPIQMGEVIVSNILDTGVNIVASRSMSS